MAVTAPYNRIDRYVVQARLRHPLHVGSAEKGTGEVLVHPVNMMPFVQASGIAGVFRACYENLFDDSKQILDLFGDNRETAGRIRFTDGFISEEDKSMKIELRPRIRIDSETGTSAASKGKGRDSSSGQKFEMEYIGAGQKIAFDIYVYSQIDSDETSEYESEFGCETAEQEKIELVLAQIHSGQVQFGGQKSNGCGSMEILSLKHRAFDMLKPEDRNAWAKSDLGSLYSGQSSEKKGDNNPDGLAEQDGYQERRDILEKLLTRNSYSLYAYQLTLNARTEGSILVKSIALDDEKIEGDSEKGEKKPDYVNMRNAGGRYIIPGSSVKGAVRAQFERISKHLDPKQNEKQHLNPKDKEKEAPSEHVISDAFGKEARDNDTGSAGNVRFRDVLIERIKDRNEEVDYNRIHIDRFTGGVMHTGLFKEQAVHGSLQIQVLVMKNNCRKPGLKESSSEEKPQGYSLNQQGISLDQQGNSLDQQGNSLNQRGINLDRQGISLDQQGNSLDQQGNSLNQRGISLDRQGSSVNMRDSSVNLQGSLKADRSCGMLILALRDLALGIYNLGSGYSVGRGFLRADSLEIVRWDDKKATINFLHDTADDRKVVMKTDDPDNIIVNCLRALAKFYDGDASGTDGEESGKSREASYEDVAASGKDKAASLKDGKEEA